MKKFEDFYKNEKGKEYVKGKLSDFSKIKIVDGTIHYKLYDQEGKFTPMTLPNTYSNRLLVSWIQIHDRY
jgi:hypothetical protein